MKRVVEEILRNDVEKCIAPHSGSLEMGAADYSCWREESGFVIVVIIMWESSGS